MTGPGLAMRLPAPDTAQDTEITERACRRTAAFLAAFGFASCTSLPSASDVAAVELITFEPDGVVAIEPEGRLRIVGPCVMLDTESGLTPVAWPRGTRISTAGVEVPTTSGDFRTYTFRDAVKLPATTFSADWSGLDGGGLTMCGDPDGTVIGVQHPTALSRS